MSARVIQRARVRILKPKQRRSDRRLPIRTPIAVIILEYEYRGAWKRVTIVPGFWFDGVSANWYLRLWLYLLAGRSKLEIATALHDLLCQCHGVSKEEADHAFDQVMIALKIWAPIRRAMYAAVSSSSTRNDWPQPNLTVTERTPSGLPLFFVQCPIDVIADAS
ncbi:DUF1353 domain-containing protein [Sphingomonadaceae bacterium G21617-S1]|nr:DUF1353 domain-containing protein [Sphingomonadaceae bacterium G21617-S1]